MSATLKDSVGNRRISKMQIVRSVRGCKARAHREMRRCGGGVETKMDGKSWGKAYNVPMRISPHLQGAVALDAGREDRANPARRINLNGAFGPQKGEVWIGNNY